MLWFALGCASTPVDDSRGTGGTSSAGSASQAGTGGGSDSAAGGVGTEPEQTCLGAAGSPTDGKGCGCHADCDSGQGCLSEQTSGMPGGACVQNCQTADDCQPSFDCVELTAGDEGTGTCWRTCASSDDCGTGWVCGPFAAVNSSAVALNLPAGNFCQPFCQSDADCSSTHVCNRYTGACGAPGPEKSDIGELCAAAADCTQACLTAKPGGYCSAVCSLSRQGCPDGASCVAIFKGAGDFGACLKQCQDSSDCTGNYDCVSDPAGGKVCR